MFYEKIPTLTCCGDQKNNTKGLDSETGCLAVVASTRRAPTATVSDFVEGWAEHSRDDTLPSPENQRPDFHTDSHSAAVQQTVSLFKSVRPGRLENKPFVVSYHNSSTVKIKDDYYC